MGRKRNRKGRCVRRNSKFFENEEAGEPTVLKNAPHSFVMHRGKVGAFAAELVRDFRNVMDPFTASSLKVTKRNTLKDFISIAGSLHITHFCMFTRTDLSLYLRLACIPHGPSLSFRIHNYTLARDVVSSLKKQVASVLHFKSSPLIVLNGFSGPGLHLKLMTSMFQNMFPSINLLTVNLSDVRRCVLFNYDPVSKLVDFRHYAIKVVPASVSKSVKKLVMNKVPNLSQYESISQFISSPVNLSESEADDDKACQVVLPQNLSSRGNMASHVSAIRVYEIGPRLTLQLLKAESGFLAGDILYHDYIKKTASEIKLQKEKLISKQELKEKRRRIQEENVRKKEMKAMKDKHLKLKQSKSSKRNGVDEHDEEDDDSEWFKGEVGEEPDSGLFSETPSEGKKRKRLPSEMFRNKKLKRAKSSTVLAQSKVKKFSKKGKLKFGKK